MLIYAFIVPYIHKNAFKQKLGLHMHICAHIHTPLHNFICEDITMLGSVPITMHTGA